MTEKKEKYNIINSYKGFAGIRLHSCHASFGGGLCRQRPRTGLRRGVSERRAGSTEWVRRVGFMPPRQGRFVGEKAAATELGIDGIGYG
jgi:hypothetical protein